MKRTPFPRTFYVANVMEIFERMAWYGFFAVSSLYMSSPLEQGGMGFTSIERGILQGIIPFLLYLFPVITGALADRYGYKRTFFVAYAIMAPAYILLGQVQGFWPFFFVFLLVAVGAATFKPVVVGTVGKTTDDTNRGLGFGVFYTIVNIGGFFGPLVAGMVRAISWDMVFWMSGIWIAVNFIPLLTMYEEPTSEAESSEKRSLSQVLLDAQEVLGNGRFALTVIPIVILFMLAGGDWMNWWWTLGGSAAWIVINQFIGGRISLVTFVPYVVALQYGSTYYGIIEKTQLPPDWRIHALAAGVWVVIMGAVLVLNNNKSDVISTGEPWYKIKPQIGNWPFVLYLVVLTGFWASFIQIFITYPEYIRDFVDTTDLVNAARIFGDGFINFVANVNTQDLSGEIGRLVGEFGAVTSENAKDVFLKLVHYKVRVPTEEIVASFQTLSAAGAATPEALNALATEWAGKYRQVNPEYMINFNAGAIICFQIIVSRIIDRWNPFPVLIAGTIVAGIGIAMGGIPHGMVLGGTFCLISIVTFSFGEMIASPKSQEYVARIAPGNKTALFMGYYFVAIALGNLFGGILSGWGYQKMALDMNQPTLMWMVFGCVGFLTAIALFFFNKSVVPKLEAQRETK
jgi:POT family proton-dependent oligopeptide transporter